MTVSEYSLLKQQLVMCVSSSDRMNQTLLELKEHFRDKINSPRRCEQIRTIGQLLHVLEVRDILSEDNVQALKEIVQINKCNSQLINKINEYERYHVVREFNNFYGPNNTENATRKEPFEKISSNNPYAHLNNNKMRRIHETLTEQIGTYWRDLARNLKISECEIDNIESSCVSLQSKAEKMFEKIEKHKEKADTQKWLLVLCEALEKSRRKDLAKELQDILHMNI